MKTILKTIFLSVLAVVGWAQTFTTALASPPAGYQLVWSDEFSGTSLDIKRWGHWLLGKRRDAVNVTNAVSVGNGVLIIQTYTDGGTHYTGMISTVDRYQPKYGWIEARIAWSDSPGMWSAYWMQSPTMGRMIGNAAQSGTEIDIVEHRKQDKGGANIDGQGISNIHWDGYRANHRKSAGSPLYGSGLHVGYHTYAMEWTTNYQKFYVDDGLVWTFSNTNGLSQRSEFLIFSSEVDNNAWVRPVPAGGYGSQTNSTTQMKVDWVRVYQLKPAAPSAPTGVSAARLDGKVQLVWQFTDNAGRFTVKRSTISGGPYVEVAMNLIGTNYIDTGVVNNTTYYYVVSALNADSESANSAEVSATQ